MLRPDMARDQEGAWTPLTGFARCLQGDCGSAQLAGEDFPWNSPRQRETLMPEDTGPAGTEWTQAEIDLIVADYFAMRAKSLRGEPFVKARHYEAIVDRTGRSKGSVERKYMNISAVLERLSLPWLEGYAPARNFQGALLQAVEQYVDAEWESDVAGPPTNEANQLAMEPPPERLGLPASDSPELERIARKFDPALRDARNRKTGLAGEKRVFDSEIIRLNQEGRPDLARKVSWVSQELGDGAGYDILSYDLGGTERFLEVKTTVGHKRTPFYLTRNERDFAEEASDRFRIFRLYDWARAPKAFLIQPPLERALMLEPTAYRASFR